jgi:hypothetical protein
MSDPSILLYGVVGAEARAEETLESVLGRSGVHDQPLSLLPCGPLALLVSPVESAGALERPAPATVLAYKDVVEAAYAARPLVPLRFGTTAANRDAARSLVRDRADALRAQLDRFEGRVEIGVRLELAPPAQSPPDPAAEAASGRAYLEARRDERRGAAGTVDSLLAAYRSALGSACVDATGERKAASTSPVVSLAFLVPRDRASALQDRLANPSPDAVREAHVVGPWAPYSFAAL